MDVISKSIADIRFKIPRQILEAVFINRLNQWRRSQYNVDQLILDLVVKPRVLVDCNLTGGNEVYISLAGIPVERINDYTIVYRIPKDKTQGRSILSVKNITMSDMNRSAGYGATMAGGSTGNILSAGGAVMDAMSGIPAISTANVRLIGENIVMCSDAQTMPLNSYLRCVLEHDETMSHIQPRSYLYFSKLIEYAVKAYIYNEIVIDMGSAMLSGGQDLGVFKDIVDGYADSNELYETHLREVITKVQFMNDSTMMTRHIRLLVGGNR